MSSNDMLCGKENVIATLSELLHAMDTRCMKNCIFHDDVIKWKHFPRYWPFVRGIYRSPANSPQGQWRGALMFSLICAWINGWVNSREAGDFRRHRTHYDVIVMVAWQHGDQVITRHVCLHTLAYLWYTGKQCILQTEANRIYMYEPFWYWSQIIPAELGRYNGYWCPGSSRRPSWADIELTV